jgi:DNA repair protein RadC
VAFLNRANKVINQQCISKGGVNATVVDLRMIFQKAILQKASALIVAHNHPSGLLDPSNEDIKLTKKLVEGCGFFDIQFLDHLILSGDKYYSFADDGKI